MGLGGRGMGLGGRGKGLGGRGMGLGGRGEGLGGRGKGLGGAWNDFVVDPCMHWAKDDSLFSLEDFVVLLASPARTRSWPC